MVTRNLNVSDQRTESSVPFVQAEIEKMIVRGEIKERVNESSVASKLGVSRGPVREACRLLERVGLLKSVMNKGFYIRLLSAKEALDLYDLRIMLFGMVGRLATPRMTDLHLHGLEQLYQDMEQAAGAGDNVHFYNLNTEFHQQLVEIADNYKIAEIWPTLESELQLFRRRGLASASLMLASNREHRSILDALASGNAVQAARVMEQHIAEGKARLLRTIQG